jgi:porin
MKTCEHLLATAILTFLCVASSAFAGSADTCTTAITSTPSLLTSAESIVKKWWNGPSGTADWLGLGYTLKDYGLSISGQAKETFLGQISPAAQPPTANGKNEKNIPVNNWGTEIKINFIYDFEKVFCIQGLTVESDWRYRNIDGNPNCPYTAQAAGTSGVFNPNKDTSGGGVRIMSQFLQYQTEKGSDPRFLVKAGWINPYEDFLRQPDSKFFENNAIASAKGIGGTPYGYTQTGANTHSPYSVTPVPWSSSYDSWGGMLRGKPSATTYLQSYLGLAIAGYGGLQDTDITTASYNNHGFNFQGTAAFDPNTKNQQGRYAYGQNGVYNVNEFGWTPKLGPDKLEGHYAIGNYIWGQNNNDFGSHSGNATISGLYLQADQRLTAVHEDPVASSSSGKNPKSTVATTPSKTRGLYSFTEFTYTSAANCSLPFYYQTGLVYKGLLESRSHDKTGIAVGEGFYSMNLNDSLTKAANKNGAAGGYASHYFSTTAVFEWFYDISINKWLDLIPDVQYIMNPTGNGSTGNAAILGFTIIAKF